MNVSLLFKVTQLYQLIKHTIFIHRSPYPNYGIYIKGRYLLHSIGHSESHAS